MPSAPLAISVPPSPRSHAFDRHRFVAPRPSAAFMGLMGVGNDVAMLTGTPLLRRVPLLGRIPPLRGLLDVERMDLPEEDALLLRAQLDGNRPVFLAPNHPEFFTDWMVDKHVAHHVAPRMAFWATADIINADAVTQRFWLWNNVVAAVPGGGGQAFSVHWALQGHGVLLHPEGQVYWTAGYVHPLFPGIVNMALETSRWLTRPGDPPVTILPLCYRSHFTGDVSAGLHREMERLERGLGIPSPWRMDVVSRFTALQVLTLLRQMARFGFPATPTEIPPHRFFAWQKLFQGWLVERCGATPMQPGQSLQLFTHQLSKRGAPKDLVDEIFRLGGFIPEAYDGAQLTQEQMAESLKRMAKDLFQTGWLNGLRNLVPLPVGPRVMHIRVGAPLDVTRAHAAARDAGEAVVEALGVDLRSRMQAGVDRAGREMADGQGRFAQPNPFCSRQAPLTLTQAEWETPCA